MKFEIKFHSAWKQSIEIEGDSLKDALEKNKTMDMSYVDLSRTDLEGINFEGFNLTRAYLVEASLKEANFRFADISYANLRGANCKKADFSGAKCEGADFSEADFLGANCEGTDFSGANFDFSCWPLWCGSLGVRIGKRLFCQLLYHTIQAGQSVNDPEIKKICEMESVLNIANQFHRVEECGKIETKK